MRLDILLDCYTSRYDSLAKRLTNANVVFLDRYVSWPKNIRDWACWDEVQHYVSNPADYWMKYNRHHPFLSENCFDPNTGDQPRGFRYHDNFRKLGLDCGYASKIEFVELVSAPVSGTIDYDGEGYASDVAVLHGLFADLKHLKLITDLVFHGNNQVIFVSRNVHNLLRYRQQEIFRLEREYLTTAFPNDPFVFRVLFQIQNNYMISCQDFASIDNDAYYPRYRRLIDAVIFGFEMLWEVVLPGNGAKLSLTCSFHDLQDNLKSLGYNLDSLVGVSINPLKRIVPGVYQLPVLKEFFSNMDSDRTIHCLIHSIGAIGEKAKCIPHIKDYYGTFRHLLEPENQILIDSCLEECTRLIADKNTSLPTAADSIRDTFYRFTFRSLTGLMDKAPGDYFYAEKAVLHTIWNTVLDNLSRHGCGDKATLVVNQDKAANQLTIEVVDQFNSFCFVEFIKANKSALTYTKMSRFGELCIQSGNEAWSSNNPGNATQAAEYSEGTIIRLKFVLPED